MSLFKKIVDHVKQTAKAQIAPGFTGDALQGYRGPVVGLAGALGGNKFQGRVGSVFDKARKYQNFEQMAKGVKKYMNPKMPEVPEAGQSALSELISERRRGGRGRSLLSSRMTADPLGL